MSCSVVVRYVAIYVFTVTSSCCLSQNQGCTDPQAQNYDPSAIENNGSCQYATTTVSPIFSWDLPNQVSETSGLIHFNGSLWTHNDNADVHLYQIDTTANPVTLNGVALSLLTNIDWEEISQDSAFVYIGDTGNNGNGNRTDLKILRINKNSLLSQEPLIDTIWFAYSTQTDFTGTGPNNSDYDCEAFVVMGDSILLFTKEWVSNKTRVFGFPKEPGTYQASFLYEHNINGLVTGATYHASSNLIALSCYTETLQPFLYVLYDYPPSNIFNGNKRRFGLNLMFHQVEGITTIDGKNFYVSNEYFEQSIISTAQKLHRINLGEYLSNFIEGVGFPEDFKESFSVYPNPISDHLTIKCTDQFVGREFTIFDISGRIHFRSRFDAQVTYVPAVELQSGAFLFMSVSGSEQVVEIGKF